MRETQKGIFVPKFPKKYAGHGKDIVYRSSWERMLMERFDLASNIILWASEEIQIAYISPLDGEWHRYFPDFLVKQRNKDGSIVNLLIECKPLHEVLRPVKRPNQKAKTWNESVKKWAVNVTKWKYAIAWCRRHNAKFIIATKKDGYDKFRLITESELQAELNLG